jgi:hypothetical protein
MGAFIKLTGYEGSPLWIRRDSIDMFGVSEYEDKRAKTAILVNNVWCYAAETPEAVAKLLADGE